MRIRTRRLAKFVLLAVLGALTAVIVLADRRPTDAHARDASLLAVRRLVDGRAADARRLADRALAADPDDADARFVRAVLRSAAGDRAGAVGDIEACARASPADCVACLDAAVATASTAGANAVSRDRAKTWFEEASARARAALERDTSDVRAALVDAAACVALGRLDDAERRLDAVGTPDGALRDDVDALRAAALVARGRDVEARDLLRRAVKERGSPASAAMLASLDAAPRALFHAGLEAARRGDLAAARPLFADAARMSPDDLAPVTLLAAMLVGPDAAHAAEDEAKRLSPGDAKGAGAPFLVANVLYLAGDVDGAAAMFRHALGGAPDDASALCGAVIGELASDRASSAVALCRERIARGGAPGVVDLLLGAALEDVGDDAGAEAAYREAIRKDAANWPASDRLAALLLARGDVAGAAATCYAGLAADPTCLPLRVRRADVWLAAGEATRAVELLSAEARDRSASGVVLLHLARALSTSGDRRRAAETFDACARADPTCVEARVAVIALAAADGRLDAVAASLRDEAASRPRDPVPRFALGVAAETAGELAAAEREYRAALSLAPRFGVAANNLAWLLAERLGRPADARPFAETAGRLLPRNPHVLDTRGWIRLRCGDADAAESDLARAARMLPGRRDVADRHAQALAALETRDDRTFELEPTEETSR